MDRASDSGSEGWGFESLPVYHISRLTLIELDGNFLYPKRYRNTHILRENRTLSENDYFKMCISLKSPPFSRVTNRHPCNELLYYANELFYTNCRYLPVYDKRRWFVAARIVTFIKRTSFFVSYGITIKSRNWKSFFIILRYGQFLRQRFWKYFIFG